MLLVSEMLSTSLTSVLKNLIRMGYHLVKVSDRPGIPPPGVGIVYTHYSLSQMSICHTICSHHISIPYASKFSWDSNTNAYVCNFVQYSPACEFNDYQCS